MPSAQHSVSIDRPLDKVLAFFTDPRTSSSGAVRSKKSDGGAAAVGRRVYQVVKGPGGLSVSSLIAALRAIALTRWR